MLNRVAKFLLVASSLAPVLGAVAINQLARKVHWMQAVGWVGAAVQLVFICWLMLRLAATHLQFELLSVSDLERNDKEVLAFLLAYLLPFLSSREMSFAGEPWTGAYVLVIILLVFTHAGALHFNPLMGLLGYHFFSVKTDSGIRVLLISKKEALKSEFTAKVVRLAPSVFLQVK